MSLFIQFIGLITLVTNPTQPTHILIPRFTQVVSADHNVIAIPDALIIKSETDWPSSGTKSGITSYPIETRNIHISGTGTFSGDGVALPHLTCCCSNMKKGLKDDYNDSDAAPSSKKSAYLFLEHGSLVTTTADSGAYVLELKVDSADGKFTITGDTKGKKAVKIVFNIGTADKTIQFINEPSMGENHNEHWRAYYLMGKDPIGCTATPKSDEECGPSTSATGCLTEPAKSTRSSKPKKFKKAFPLPPDMTAIVDINCSNSQWP